MDVCCETPCFDTPDKDDDDKYKPKKTTTCLTSFELARLAGLLELEMQNDRTVGLGSHRSLFEKSVFEVLHKNVDVVIRRNLPNKKFEDVKLSYLTTSHLFL
tara:strand:- start:3998 stop:4303 length:306 start_codon:yes stop_codon:yes gene_type:complete